MRDTLILWRLSYGGKSNAKQLLDLLVLLDLKSSVGKCNKFKQYEAQLEKVHAYKKKCLFIFLPFLIQGARLSYDSVGQNMFRGSNDRFNWTTASQAWFNERLDYHYDNDTCKPNKECGHYTQVRSLWVCAVIIRRCDHCTQLGELCVCAARVGRMSKVSHSMWLN